MKWVLLTFLLSQGVEIEPDLVTERIRALYGNQTYTMMFTIIARYSDDSPARGHIGCTGDWYKHYDEKDDPSLTLSGVNLMFLTDSRGAIILNPGMLDYEPDVEITCYAKDRVGRTGQARFHPVDGSVFYIPIKEK